MSSSPRALYRVYSVLGMGALLFVVGFWLHLEAHDFCTTDYHLTGTPGTAMNAQVTDTDRAAALVDTARVLLGLGAVLFATGTGAWLFTPKIFPRADDNAADTSLGHASSIS